MAMTILTPWKMVGRFADLTGEVVEEITVSGVNEEDCMWKLCHLQEEYGKLVWYSGYCDEDYVDGEYIGRENFIYE